MGSKNAPNNRRQKEKKDDGSKTQRSAGKMLIGGVSVVVIGMLAASLKGNDVAVKKMDEGEVRMMLLKATKESNNGDFVKMKEITDVVYPAMGPEGLGEWDGEGGLSKTIEKALRPHRIPNNGSVELYKISGLVTPAEAESLMQIYSTAYDNYYLEAPVCLDHEWSIEPSFLLPQWYYKDRVVAAGVLSESDFTMQDTGHVKSWCLKAKSSTKRNIMKLKAFLNVSRSVIAHRGVSKITDTVEKRISDVTGLPLKKAFYAQLLQYEPGEEYNIHTDCTINRLGGSRDDRVYTTLLYLSEPEGGETAFPLLGLEFQPKLGDLIVWRNMGEDGHCNPNSAHVAKKVTSGIKYVFQKWWNIKSQDHAGSPYTQVQNGFSCDRNNACREYLYIHRMQQKLKIKVP
eukprot:TRINITY_DN10543_c0_g1_i1.p1 TRINITY_DN10543_c0_g1~~TRINITY_DN10543_c0_g1_i1.p1  ORF type:complete len:401 (+),score=73.97 TRINITY_DN10543_c0_g1_i1:49-1251(+)